MLQVPNEASYTTRLESGRLGAVMRGATTVPGLGAASKGPVSPPSSSSFPRNLSTCLKSAYALAWFLEEDWRTWSSCRPRGKPNWSKSRRRGSRSARRWRQAGMFSLLCTSGTRAPR